MRFLTTIILIQAIVLAHAQQAEIDSLKRALLNSQGQERVQILNDLSWQYKSSNLDSSRRYAFEALQAADQISSAKTKALGEAYNSIANYFEATGKVDSAEHYHLASLEMKSEIGDSLGMAASMNGLGIIYDLTDRVEKSLDYYLRALRLFERHTDNPFQIAMVQGNIGIVLKKMKEYDQAINYYSKALKIYEQEGSKFGITATNGNIGSIMINTGDFEKSIEYSEKAKAGYIELGYDRYVPYAVHNMAIAQDSLGLLTDAELNYREVIEAHSSFKNWFEVASSQNALANLLIKTGRYAEGAEIAARAIENARQVDSFEFMVRATKTLANAETRLGHFQNANSLLNAYIIGRDSLFESDKTRQIFELQTKYETEKKEQQIALQQAEIAQQKSLNERNNILLASSGGLILLLMVIGVQGRSRLKWKNRQLRAEQDRLIREAEMNAVISSQEKERSRFARDLHDGFGQLISTLNLNLKNLETPKDKTERERVFDASARVLEEMYQELKNICFDLMPQTLIKHGLEPALKEFANRVNISGQKYVEVNVFGLVERLTDLQEISLYRISQEWTNNIIKYSDAERITIQVTRDQDEITLLIEDDGAGFDRNLLIQGKGNGWKNMTSRANLINGEIELDTRPGQKGNALILNSMLVLDKKPVLADEIPA